MQTQARMKKEVRVSPQSWRTVFDPSSANLGSHEEGSVCQPIKAGARSLILRVQRYTISMIPPNKLSENSFPKHKHHISAKITSGDVPMSIIAESFPPVAFRE